MEISPHVFPGVYVIGNRIYTINRNPGHSVYGEVLLYDDGTDTEYRAWDPNRSKLGAWIKCGARSFPFSSDTKVLYLGAASGTTVSHLSDICFAGTIFAVEFSFRNFQKLLSLSKTRDNIIPISEDARFPERYRSLVGDVDCIYQDISQKDQVKIMDSNALTLIQKGRPIMLMLKARSVDVTSRPSKIFDLTSRELADMGYLFKESIELKPYQKDHMVYLLERA